MKTVGEVEFVIYKLYGVRDRIGVGIQIGVEVRIGIGVGNGIEIGIENGI